MRNKTTYNVSIESRPIKLAFKGPENASLHVPDLTHARYSSLHELCRIVSNWQNRRNTSPKFQIIEKNIGQQFRKYFFLRFYDSTTLHHILIMKKMLS